LELPKRQGPVERELNIKREASYIIAVKNPKTPSPPNIGLGRKQEAEFPKALQEKFEGRRLVPVDPPDFLNYEGEEVVLIGPVRMPSKSLASNSERTRRPNARPTCSRI
jgi:hypothetical protein